MKHGCAMAKLNAVELRMFTEFSSHCFELLALLLLLLFQLQPCYIVSIFETFWVCL
jgi:hypothetical protein